MRNISLFLASFFFAICLFTSCNLNEDPLPDVDITLFNISGDLEEWLLPFDSVGQSIQYTNSSSDSIVSVVVERTYSRTSQSFTECQIDDQSGDCEFNSINIAFPENIHPDNFQAFVSIFLIAPNELQIMANRIGFSTPFARLNVDSEEIQSELPGNYSSSYLSNFDYNGIESPAILTQTITLENAPDGAIIAPKSMILVKGVGVVEWEDFNGNIWTLQN